MERFNERGKQAFIFATRSYTEQRGRRMAQRVIRDGGELNPASFEQYRELQANHEIDFKSLSPDLVMNVTRCEWRDQFEAMGQSDAGLEYCKHLDLALMRGFNPYNDYRVEHYYEDGNCCRHTLKNAGMTKDSSRVPPEGGERSMEYHCANIYWVFNRTMSSIFGYEGEKVNIMVLDDFFEEFGKEMTDTLISYKDVDFVSCDSR